MKYSIFVAKTTKPMSRVAAYYHIVFCTKGREMTIPSEFKEDLYRFIWKIIVESKSHLIRIGGIANHLHILLDLHPDQTLSGLVREIKAQSSGWMKSDDRFSRFRGWGSGYYGSSVSPQAREGVIEYIKNQEAHHSTSHLDEEFMQLHALASLRYDARDFS